MTSITDQIKLELQEKASFSFTGTTKGRSSYNEPHVALKRIMPIIEKLIEQRDLLIDSISNIAEKPEQRDIGKKIADEELLKLLRGEKL